MALKYARPLVSVIIPVYNGEDFLADAIRSVERQAPFPFELIVVDDGSDNPQAVRDIVDTFHDLPVRFFRKENGGVSTALNLGIAAAQGEAIAWLSHDDVMAEGRLVRQWRQWERLGQDPKTILYGDYETFGDGTKPRVVVTHAVPCDKRGQSALFLGRLNGCTMLIPMRLVHEVGNFDEGIRCTQDYDYWLRALLAGCTFRRNAGVLAYTRLHPAQTWKGSATFTDETRTLWGRLVLEALQFEKNQALRCVVLSTMHLTMRRSRLLAQVGIQPLLARLRSELQACRTGWLLSVICWTFYNVCIRATKFLAHLLRAWLRAASPLGASGQPWRTT